MHDTHLTIIFVGILVGLGLASMYLWLRNRLDAYTFVNVVCFGALLGLIASGSLFSGWFIFSVIMAAYGVYFCYLKDYCEFNLHNEGAMVSVAAGFLIGFFGLIGCVVCHA